MVADKVNPNLKCKKLMARARDVSLLLWLSSSSRKNHFQVVIVPAGNHPNCFQLKLTMNLVKFEVEIPIKTSRIKRGIKLTEPKQ